MDPELELEVDERIYEAVADLMVSASGSSGSLTEPPESHRTFLYDQPDWAASSANPSDVSDTSGPTGAIGAAAARERERRITLLEEQVVLQAGTTGLRTWTAALHLGHHILSHPQLLFRQPASQDDTSPLPLDIVELGAGTGFLSILLAQLSSDVISTDLGEPGDSQGDEQTPFKRLMFNARLNEVSTGGRLRVEALDWTDASRDEMDRPGIWRTLMAPRTVVAADVIYDPDLVPPLVATIRVLIGAKRRHDHGSHEHRQSEAIIAATLRNPATLRLFQDTCEKEDLLVETLDLKPMDNDDPTFWDSGLDRSASVRIMRITPRAPAA
ncbi:hypothetical protein EHS25_003334 [Saitozyma podzolica]|uniref:Uncharacterized protein n=1 Tax=Saitozyma podzolica TaxID=1890683 RepID=A0A427Y8T2_9TREE|nr:hypothetical protein EHS25_003334 [Saitozyma podzolica]